MNGANQKIFHRYSLLLGAILIWGTAVLFIIGGEMDNILKKEFAPMDETVHSVVSANITRKFFPPMVRINPLVEHRQRAWMEGPYWQHIPPLFMYVPWVFFKLDGKISIEMLRLSYVWVMFVTGALFISTVYLFDSSLLSLIAGTLAVILWMATPFSRGLIYGREFNTSDIVLAFAIICSFTAICYYLRRDQKDRIRYSTVLMACLAVATTLPVLIKSVLGLIPWATFLILILRDHKRINRYFLVPCFVFLGMVGVYYGALYFSSPQTFMYEIQVPFFHFKNYEGWGKPWDYFLIFYLPEKYLGVWTGIYFSSMIIGLYGLYLHRDVYKDRAKKILLLSIGWFAWNLLVISIVRTKSPNFIYQSYLLSIFFSIYACILLMKHSNEGVTWGRQLQEYSRKNKFLIRFRPWALGILLVIFIGSCGSFSNQFYKNRESPRRETSLHERFYYFAEKFHQKGQRGDVICILNTSRDPQEDCIFRYYMLFLTGAEARALKEIDVDRDVDKLKKKYSEICFIFADGWKPPFNIGIPYTIEEIDQFVVLRLSSRDMGIDLLRKIKAFDVTKGKGIMGGECQWPGMSKGVE